jgi:mono/diheme cytochrome c family protein/DNA-binding beta-propeller fold protein YncE
VGSTVALARSGERTLAYIADEDARAVRVVDLQGTGAKELGRTALRGSPSQLLVAADGRVMVTLRDRDELVALEPAADPAAALTELCALPTASEPVALAVTPDDKSLLVTSGWGATLAAHHLADLSPSWRVALAREPRAVVVADDGKKAFVTHVVGSRLSVVDLASPEHAVRALALDGEEPNARQRGVVDSLLGSTESRDRTACQGFALAKTVEPAGRVLAPQVLVDPGDAEQPSSGYGSGGAVPVEVANVAVIDAASGAAMSASLRVDPPLARMGPATPSGCLLPRAATVDPGSGTLLVACMGIDSLVQYDAASVAPHRAEMARFAVGAGPSGVAVERSKNRAVVWSQFARTVSIVDLARVSEPAAAVTRATLPATERPAVAETLARGRELFHASDERISDDGRACASCHPDGRDDSLTWSTPNGPRQTPMLAGRLAKTAPFGWNGDGESVHQHLEQTFQRLGGRGLRGDELEALIAYATSVATPRRNAPVDATLAEEGRALFHSAATGCAGCHVDGAETDRAAHDVGTKVKADSAPGFDTPSLRFVGGTAPYFHDGRYATLRALLADSSSKMGHTQHLDARERAALEAYLRTL